MPATRRWTAPSRPPPSRFSAERDALLGDAPAERAVLLPDLARAVKDTGSLAEAEDVFGEAIASPARSATRSPSSAPRSGSAISRTCSARASGDELRALAERAIATFEDDADLADAWQLIGTAHLAPASARLSSQALLHAREHALACGDLRRQIDAWNQIGGCDGLRPDAAPRSAGVLRGADRVGEASAICPPSRRTRCSWARTSTRGSATSSSPASSWRGRRRSAATWASLTALRRRAWRAASSSCTAGDLPAAERELREAIDVAVGMGAAHYIALYRVRLAPYGPGDEIQLAVETIARHAAVRKCAKARDLVDIDVRAYGCVAGPSRSQRIGRVVREASRVSGSIDEWRVKR